MGKALPVLGIVAAVAATLVLLVLVSAAALLVVPVLLAGAVVLALQRAKAGFASAALVLVLAVLATLGLAGSVTTEGGTADFGISEAWGRVLAAAGCLAIPLAAVALRRDAVPRAAAYVGLALSALALLLAALRRGDLVDQSDVLTIAQSLLPLGAIVPMVALLRGEGTAAAA